MTKNQSNSAVGIQSKSNTQYENKGRYLRQIAEKDWADIAKSGDIAEKHSIIQDFDSKFGKR